MIQAPSINDPVESCVTALEDYFKREMPVLQTIIHDFPSPNEELIYPALSIMPDPSGGYSAITPYLESQEEPVNNLSSTLWIVGQWDFKIQMDFWARNKVERNQLFSHFYKVFNPEVEPMGLRLKLNNYFGLWVSYTINGYEHKDNEQASQRQEWRTMIGLLVHAKHALNQKQFLMTQTIAIDQSLDA